MHLDWFVADLLSALGLSAGTVILFAVGLTLSYFVIKWAVRDGVREALQWEKKGQIREGEMGNINEK